MCLIVVAHRVHPVYSLVIAANRDEFLNRPAEAMHWWTDHSDILAGRDKRAGGTWMGVHRDGRWAAITNFRRRGEDQSGRPSRGEIVTGFLTSDKNACEYLADLDATADAYNGFNLLLGLPEEIYYYGNRVPARQQRFEPLPPGVYGLSNHLLDTPWPKVELAMSRLRKLCQSTDALEHKAIIEMLQDSSRPEDARLPDTGIGLDKERLLSAMFIQSDDYGTRCSTSLLADNGLIRIREFTHDSAATAEFEIDR
ncbi:MAG: NRDE family protein [Planctomycetota bacterium]